MTYKYKNLFFLLFFCIEIFAQGENNLWSLNANTILNFNQTPPQLIETGNFLFTNGLSTTVCDSGGNLLFYTNGRDVIDRFHERMPNGRLHFNTNYSQMPAVIIPMFNNKNKYYLFTLFTGVNFLEYQPGMLYYSVINMNLNGGRGDVEVIENQSVIPLQSGLSGKLIAARGKCGSIWVITHEINNNRFLAYEINGNGIKSPVISEVGTILTDNGTWGEEGFMSLSEDSEKLVVCGGWGNFVEILNFNRETGIISNPITLPIEESTTVAQSASFSPDGSKLYVIEKDTILDASIFQFDLNNNVNKTFIRRINWFPHQNLELAPNKVIYIRESEGTISAIFSPNNPPSNIDFKDSVYTAANNVINWSALQNRVILPTPPSQIDSLLLPQDTQLCQNTQLNLQIQAQGDTYQWQDGSTTPNYEITAPGTYWVNVQKGNCTFTDTIKILPDESYVEIGADTTLCENQTLNLQINTQEGLAYQWQDGSTEVSFTVTEAGTYWVESIDSLCTQRDSIEVAIKAIRTNLPSDTIRCPNESILLNVAQQNPSNLTNATYLWQDGSTSPTYAVNEAGIYWVTMIKDDCTILDTIEVKTIQQRTFLPNDTLICNEPSFVVAPGPPFTQIVWWDTSSLGDTLLVTESGLYHAIIIDQGCSWGDSIYVDFTQIVVELPSDTILCRETNLLLDLGQAEGRFRWQDGSSNTQFLVQQSGQYWVKLEDKGCLASDTINIQYENLQFDLGENTALCEGEILQLSTNISNASYLWQDGSNESSLNLTTAGLYWLAINKNGCKERDSILVEVQNCEEDLCKIFIPNVFSPNNDGINDAFQLFSNCDLASYSLEIYDRWGNLVFSTNSEQIVWDGTQNGELLENGVYLVKSEYQLPDQNRPIVEVKTLTLVR